MIPYIEVKFRREINQQYIIITTIIITPIAKWRLTLGAMYNFCYNYYQSSGKMGYIKRGLRINYTWINFGLVSFQMQFVVITIDYLQR